MAEYCHIVARSVRLLPPCVREDVHVTRQLHWINDGLVNAMPNMQKTLLQFTSCTCLDKIVCYLQRIVNWNRKLKQQVSK